ncbi:MAG: hypothetical protein JW741_26515 [Sedimentisphaerales bacterium]|nr:hypothetical protein [Sedimentisphaerales bacterium]
MDRFWSKVVSIGLCGCVVAAAAGAAASSGAGASPSGREATAERGTKDIPEFEFTVWGHPPSRQVYRLQDERLVQKILFVLRGGALPVGDVAVRIGTTDSDVSGKLDELARFGLVQQEGPRWISNIPLYVRAEIEAGEKLSMEYAERQAEILRRAIPGLRDLYSETKLASSFPWEQTSLLVVGALLSDFCVFDRVAFRPENADHGRRFPLQAPDGTRWGFTGYEKLPKRFPSCRWTFYHNQFHTYAGGMARFGYYGNPYEQRKNPIISPGKWCAGIHGKVLFALAEGPLSSAELESSTRLNREFQHKTLEEMAGCDPPAVALDGGRYHAGIPVFTEPDFQRVLAACDRVAEEIHHKVVLPHGAELEARGKEMGLRWPLPSGTYVRDRALQMLVDEGVLSPVPAAPVDWDFGVWAWKGFLQMNEEVTTGATPDPFLLTAISSDEENRLRRADTVKAEILQGNRFQDVSTPARAFLTRLSAVVHSDVEAMKAVSAAHIDEQYFAAPQRRNWAQQMRYLNIHRIPSVPADPRTGDVSPVFAIYDQGFEEAHVYFYHDGGWRFLFNTYAVRSWSDGAEGRAQAKLLALQNK